MWLGEPHTASPTFSVATLDPTSTTSPARSRPWTQGSFQPLTRRRLHVFAYANAFSLEDARRDFGYAPSVELEAGLSRAAAWYRSLLERLGASVEEL